MNPNNHHENSLHDPDVDPEELIEAAQEDQTPANPPEVMQGTEEIIEWDEPSDTFGHEVPKVLMDDDQNVAEELVSEGIDEADREQRIAAADPDSDG